MFDFGKIKNQKIIVIGDVMLDAYVFGKVDRISPEAPVPVVIEQHREYRLGGAANVALNLKALGANPVMIGIVGDDIDAIKLKEELEKNAISSAGLIEVTGRPTTLKTRVIGNNHQLLRIDNEVTNPISLATENSILEKLKNELTGALALVIEDYEKGLLSESIIHKIIELSNANNVPVVVDPKKNNFLSYTNIALFKPNLKEIREGLKLNKLDSLEDIKEAAKSLIKKMNLRYIMVTLSERGVLICDENDSIHIPAHIRQIADVSGAGDTVISIAALGIAQNLSMKEIAEMSNLAGGLVCEEVGVVPVDKEILMAEAKKMNLIL